MKIETFETAAEAPDDPFTLFHIWYAEEQAAEDIFPDSMCLATADAQGRPSARIMLLKGLDERGFVFYTNKQSRKGDDLDQNPQAALCFYWKGPERQVRVEGKIEHVSAEESDEYFATRPRGSQIGAWASRQSQPLARRTELFDRVGENELKHENDEIVPRPPHWGGYRLVPDHIEFWRMGDFRLHTRILYTRHGELWAKEMLNP
ncbi:MAG: pyridoxamine 5'-phosphate oxidase [Rhodospirillales bacterium]|nr:pyridoxamine 5'-phosphate oxidase [Rhodospirillales bacterium]